MSTKFNSRFIGTLIALSQLLVACGQPYFKSLEPGYQLSQKINVPHATRVSVGFESVDHRSRNFWGMGSEISEAVTECLEYSLFSDTAQSDDPEILLNVSVRELKYRTRINVIGVIPPFSFLAVLGLLPGELHESSAIVEARIVTPEGLTLGHWESTKVVAKGYGLYSANCNTSVHDGGAGRLAIQEALDDVKRQIDVDRNRLVAAINDLERQQNAVAVKDHPSESGQAVPRERTEPPSPLPAKMSDVDLSIPRGRVEHNDAVAVIIGNRDYTCTDVPAVDYAINDASIVKRYVTDLLGYREGNVIYVENATGAELRSVFGSEQYPGRLANMMKEGSSDVFVYYSGHGAPDPNNLQGYFIPVDCCPDEARLNGYPLETFYQNMAKLSPRSLTIVIDACFSGGSNAGMLIGQASPLAIEVENPAVLGPGRAVFTSSSGTEISSWYPEMKHGLFTYFFLKGLKGEADQNGDLVLTSGELFDYVSDKTNAVPYLARTLYKGRTQTPTFSGDSTVALVEY